MTSTSFTNYCTEAWNGLDYLINLLKQNCMGKHKTKEMIILQIVIPVVHVECE